MIVQRKGNVKLVGVVIESEEGSGVGVRRPANEDDEPSLWIVYQKDDGRWHTVDSFENIEDAEEAFQELLEMEEE